jgi:hypothetical protein
VKWFLLRIGHAVVLVRCRRHGSIQQKRRENDISTSSASDSGYGREGVSRVVVVCRRLLSVVGSPKNCPRSITGQTLNMTGLSLKLEVQEVQSLHMTTFSILLSSLITTFEPLETKPRNAKAILD